MSDAAYDDAFYDFASDAARRSAEEVVPLLLAATNARSIVDIGCGTGSWLSVFRRHGVTDVCSVSMRTMSTGVDSR